MLAPARGWGRIVEWRRNAEFRVGTARTYVLGGIDVPAAKFTFENGEGKLLSGLLESPEGTPRGWAIFAHCFTCGKDSRAAVHISRALSRAGIGVLRFDFAGTGVGGAEGEAVDFAADVTDLKSDGNGRSTTAGT